MPQVEEFNFSCYELRDYEKYIINAALEESVNVDPSEDDFTQRFFQNELVDHIQLANKIVFVPLERDKLHIAVSYLKCIMTRNCRYLADPVMKSVKFTPSAKIINHSKNVLLIQNIISDLHFVLNSWDDEFNVVNSIRAMLQYLEDCIGSYGLYPAYIIACLYQIKLEKFRLCTNQSYLILSSIISDFNVIRSLLEHELSKNNLLNDAKSIINYSDEKIVKLISLLYDMDFQDNCVIFVSDGETAQVVTHIFEKLIDDKFMPHLSVSCVTDPSNDCSSEREEILREKFRRTAFRKHDPGEASEEMELLKGFLELDVSLKESPPIKNLSYIKNITALEVVKSLYKLGNIDSDLNPTVKNIDRELHDVNLFPYWRDEDDANLRGSGSSFNVVSLNFPEWLNDSSPRADEPCYLHVINLNPTYTVPASSSRKQFFLNLMMSPLEYGILTRKKLPQMWMPGQSNNDRLLQDYIITNVLSNCTPSSSFPSFDYESYSEYYYDKYGLEIKQPLQPLLEARSVNTNLNCLRPRAQKPGTQRRRGEKLKDFEETLVPEFCILQQFPAVYWYKSMTLVSVLHRLHYALNAEAMRRRFASATASSSFPEAGDDDRDILIEDSSCINELDDLGKPVVAISSILQDVKLGRKIRSYPWSYDQVPREIDKNICKSSILEIMDYYDFVTPSLKLSTGETSASYKQTPIKDREVNLTLEFLNIDKDLHPVPKQCDIIQALTARQCKDIVNLERFKIVGNAFLHFAASLMLYKFYPELNICQLRSLRHKLTGNRNLYYCGCRMELGSFLKLQDISVSNDWNVGGFSVPEVLIHILKNSEVPPEAIFNVELTRDEQASGILNSKTRVNVNESMISYCNERIKSGNVFSAEAASTLTENNNHALGYLGKLCVPEDGVVKSLKSLIGAYLMNCGVPSTLFVLQRVGLLRQNIEISELFSNCDESNLVGYQFSGFETVCERINYKFKSTKLPYSAFVHHSYFPDNDVECNQRLAFLGDAILDVLITTYVHETCKHLPVDHNEDLRISLANDILYAVLVVRLGLHKFLMYESPYLMEKIDEFVRKQERVNHGIRHDDYLFLIEETNSENSGSVDVPKALSDVFKAIIAGVFLDCDGDLKIVWNVCCNIMKNELEKFLLCVPRNPARLLLDTDLRVDFGYLVVNPFVLVCSTAYLLIRFMICRSPMPCENDDSLIKMILNIEIDHCKRSFCGIGYSELQAKTVAAKLALKHLTEEVSGRIVELWLWDRQFAVSLPNSSAKVDCAGERARGPSAFGIRFCAHLARFSLPPRRSRPTLTVEAESSRSNFAQPTAKWKRPSYHRCTRASPECWSTRMNEDDMDVAFAADEDDDCGRDDGCKQSKCKHAMTRYSKPAKRAGCCVQKERLWQETDCKLYFLLFNSVAFRSPIECHVSRFLFAWPLQSEGRSNYGAGKYEYNGQKGWAGTGIRIVPKALPPAARFSFTKSFPRDRRDRNSLVAPNLLLAAMCSHLTSRLTE
ncbi:hypothetical protein V9T40_009572 [Parthenolecanium corni]|uniref:Uncharacterized protein n=1 Tax=Parthenolecanium corni TaxID=536013 RepID=A0AAN9TSK6_9HEMI